MARDDLTSPLLVIRRLQPGCSHWTLPCSLFSRLPCINTLDDAFLDPPHIPGHAFGEHRQQH